MSSWAVSPEDFLKQSSAPPQSWAVSPEDFLNPPVIRTTKVGDVPIDLPPREPDKFAGSAAALASHPWNTHEMGPQPVPSGIMNAQIGAATPEGHAGPSGIMNAQMDAPQSRLNASIQPPQERGTIGTILQGGKAAVREGAIGRATGQSSETLESLKEDPSNPLLRFEAATPHPGISRGIAQFASGLTTPENLAIMGAGAGAPAVVNKLVALGFSAKMVMDTAKQVPAVAQAIQDGDWQAASQAMVQLGLGGAMAVAGIRHGLSREPAPEPTAAHPTVPEDPNTIQMQLTQLHKGDRSVVMLPKGTPVPDLPASTPTHTDAFGNIYAYDPEKIQPAAIDQAVHTNRLPEILGAEGTGMGAPDKSQLQGPTVAVTGKSMDGTTVQSTETDAANLEATKTAVKEITPPGGSVSVEPVEQAVGERQASAPQPAPIQPTPAPEPPPVAGQAPPDIPPHTQEEAEIPLPPPTPADPADSFLSDTTYGSGLGALQPYIQRAIDTLKGNAQQTMALIAKRKAAQDALARMKATPKETQWGQDFLEYTTGERDWWGARNNQMMAALRKVIPKPVEQEAISLMRDFKGKRAELQSWLDKTHATLAGMAADDRTAAEERIERIRPVIERALNPTQAMLAADRVLTNIADMTLAEGKRMGILDSSIDSDSYVTHLLHDRDTPEVTPMESAVSKIGGKFSRRFQFAKQREYDTLLDAIADGLRPKTLNALDAFTIHGDKFATARATNMMKQEMLDAGVAKFGGHAGTAPGGIPQTNFAGAPGIPKDWVPFAPHAKPFQNMFAYMDAAGEPKPGLQDMYAMPSIEKAMRPITDPDYLNKIKGFATLRSFQAWTKAVQLGMSMFHATTENYMAMANMGPIGYAKTLMSSMDTRLFRDNELDMVLHGGSSPIQGKTFEAYKSLNGASMPQLGEIWKSVPGIKQLDQVAGGVTHFTFDVLQRKFKVMDYSMKVAAWMGDHRGATNAEVAAAKRSIAKEINAVYGGLHWENLGINRPTINAARAIILAPDWTFSNIANVKYTMMKGPGGNAARAFWLRTAVGGMAATQMLSLALTGAKSKRLTQVYIGKDKQGREIYQNVFFKGAPGDMVNLINNVGDFGLFSGLTRSLAGKLAPVLRTGTAMANNRDYLGHELVAKGLNPVASTVRGGMAIAKSLSPIPFSATNAWDMLAGPDADKYTMPEMFTTFFAGTPPSHVPPAGMRMTKNGLRVKQEKPEQSIWEQIKTNKLSAPGPVRRRR